MSKVKVYGLCQNTLYEDDGSEQYDRRFVDASDCAEAVNALRGMLDDSCYRRLSIADMQEELRLGNQAMPALIAARTVLERAP